MTFPSGVRHSVDLTADTLYEAAALGLKLLRQDSWLEPIGPATRLVVEVMQPAVKHEVTLQQIQRWAQSTAITPADRLHKNRVLEMLT